uniref:Retrotransposon gag domain-containing protein n=1 Tax=Ananas comosus var. bracteatus TaxID=296719 RepID=A0A6V7QMP9_ANACO|nr:unnamed protein product [Ananas comosus var. bracteatus]
MATTNPMNPEALQKFIDSAVVAKFKQLAQDNEPLLSESDKPSQAWHDLVPFPPGYTRPQFQMFDGTGDPENTSPILRRLVETQSQMSKYPPAKGFDNNNATNSSNQPSADKGKAIIIRGDDVSAKQDRPTFEQRLNKVYSFRREAVSKLFRQALKSQRLTLPNPARPEQVNKTDDPLYCPYHRFVGHTIEDCITFKDCRWYGTSKRKQLSDPPIRQDKEKQSESTLKPPQKHISAPHGKKSNVDYNIIAHLKRIPALLSVFDALMMAKELREALVEALLNPEPYETVMAEIHLVNQVDEEVNQITFSEEDFMTQTINIIVPYMYKDTLKESLSNAYWLIQDLQLTYFLFKHCEY